MSGDYKIGYGRPPEHTRFKPGQSGNPLGRPKGSRSLSEVVLSAFNEQVVINENGKRRKITKLEAAVKQLANKSAGGDLHAFKTALEVYRHVEAREDAQASGEAVSAAERKAMDAELLKWLSENLPQAEADAAGVLEGLAHG